MNYLYLLKKKNDLKIMKVFLKLYKIQAICFNFLMSDLKIIL